MPARRSRCRGPRRRQCRGIATALCLPAGTPTLDTRDRCEGFAHSDRREARALLDGADDAGWWARGRLLRAAEAYAEQLRAERDATTPRCAAGPAGRLAVGVVCAPGATPDPPPRSGGGRPAR